MHKNTKTESNIKEIWSIPNNDKKWLWIVGHLISHKKITSWTISIFTSQIRSIFVLYLQLTGPRWRVHTRPTWFGCATRWYAWFKRVFFFSETLFEANLWTYMESCGFWASFYLSKKSKIHSQRFSHLCCDNEDSNMFMDKLVNLFNFIMLQ